MANKTVTPIRGKNVILMFRLLEDAAKKKGAKLLYQTEHSVEASRDSDTTETKDGPISTPKGYEEEISFSSIVAKGDPVLADLEAALMYSKELELWEIDVTEPSSGEDKFSADYRRGYLTELKKSAEAEDFVTVEMTFATNGLKQSGEVKLSKEEKEAAQYPFRDTEIVAGEM